MPGYTKTSTLIQITNQQHNTTFHPKPQNEAIFIRSNSTEHNRCIEKPSKVLRGLGPSFNQFLQQSHPIP